MSNIDEQVVTDFGNEWSRFDQAADKLSPSELAEIFESYFRIFPWDSLPDESVGIDVGCGSGRWARFAASRVGTLHCVDPSAAIDVARRNLANVDNCVFHRASVDALPVPDETMDFGYSLGVLHHVPDTAAAMAQCVKKLKPGAPFLVYLYYSLDNRPKWYRRLWKISNHGRVAISKLPPRPKHTVTDLIAGTIYWPLARAARVAEFVGKDVENYPLASYRNRSFYTMRTDTLDRFGTTLEQRFSRKEIQTMMSNSGLENVQFSQESPFWCALGFKA